MSERSRKNIRIIIITLVIFSCTCYILSGLWKKAQTKDSGTNGLSGELTAFLNSQMEDAFFLLPSFWQEEKEGDSLSAFLKHSVDNILPVYAYMENNREEEITEDEIMKEFFQQKEGSDEDDKNIDEEKLDYGEDALHIENSTLAELELENGRYKEQIAGASDGRWEAEGESIGLTQEAEAENKAEYERRMQELEAALNIDKFSPAKYPSYAYDWEEQWGYEELLSNFYAVDASTSLKEEYMKLDKLLYEDLSVDKEQEGPQILIYHTHSQEAFADSVKGDESTTIVGAGDRLAEILTEEYGFRVLHHKGKYDVENRDYAYSNSLPEIEAILKENPTIEVVIDLHRDEMQEGKKLVIDLQGRPTARFMFFNGMSYIRDKGDISYLENPYIQENLAFSFQAQVTANQYYPGIARKIYLKAYRYNLHLCPKSMLIELGAQTNTVEEIMNACDPLAHIISIVLNGDV